MSSRRPSPNSNSPSRPARDHKTLLRTLRKIGKTSKIIGVEGVTNVLGDIVTAVQGVRFNKKTCHRLAVRIEDIMRALDNPTSSLTEEAVSVPTSDSLIQLKNALEPVWEHVQEIADMNTFEQTIRYSTIARVLEEQVELIDEALSLFLTQEVQRINVDLSVISASVQITYVDGLRRFRRHEIQLLGEFHETGLQLARVKDQRFLVKQYDADTEEHFAVDRDTYVQIVYAGLPQVAGVLSEADGHPMLMFQCPDPPRILNGTASTPVDLIFHLMPRNIERWKIRAVTARMFLDVYQSFDYLAKQGLQIKYDFAVSQLQVNESGKFSLFLNDLMKLPKRNVSRDVDSRQRATRFVTNCLSAANHKTTPDLTPGSGRTDPYIFPDLIATVLYRFEQLPVGVLASLPTTIPALLEEPTLALREERPGLPGWSRSLAHLHTQGQLRPGDIIHVPNSTVVLRPKKMPRVLGNYAEYFGGEVVPQPAWNGSKWNERFRFHPEHEGAQRIDRYTFRKPEDRYMCIQYGRELNCGIEEAYTRFGIIDSYLAREYDVIEGELMLVCHVDVNAHCKMVKKNDEETSDLHLFVPGIPTDTPYFSTDPVPRKSFEPAGENGTVIASDEGGYSCTVDLEVQETYCLNLWLEHVKVVESD